MLVLPSAGSESTSRQELPLATCQKGDLRRGSVAAIGRKRLVGVRVSGAGKQTLSSRCVFARPNYPSRISSENSL
jgi:hypothetical protein